MKKLRIISNQQGFFKFIFTLLIIVFLIYAGIQFGMPYYRYSSFKSDAKELARVSIGDVERTKSQIFERAQELKLPIDAKDIEVTKSARGLRVRTAWSETVDILGLYEDKIDFVVDVEE